MRIIGFKEFEEPDKDKTRVVSYVLGEDKPVCRTIQVDNERFFVSFPYVTYMFQEVFLCNLSGSNSHWASEPFQEEHRSFYVSFSQTSTTKLATALRWTGLPNIEASGEVCLGDGINKFEGELNIATFRRVVGHFWMSGFTQDMEQAEWHGTEILRQHFEVYDDAICPCRAWADASKKDSSYGLKIEWPKLDGKLCDFLWKDYTD